MTKLETVDERRFRRLIERLGGQALKQNAAFEAGIPDRLVWLPTRTRIEWFWVEWKRKGKLPEKHQLAYHDKLRLEGHTVYVFDDYKQAFLTVMSYEPKYAV